MSTRSIVRAVSLLRLIAISERSGLRLVDLSAHTGLTKATVHRLLATLIDEGLVEPGKGTKRYHLGLGLFTLGASAAGRYDLRALAKPSLERIAVETGDVAYLWVRDGSDAVCLDLQEGSYPVRVITLDVGYRRPLGIGAGSLALLASMPDEHVARIIRDDASRRAIYRKTIDDQGLYRMVRSARRLRYAFTQGLVISGLSAVGVAVVNFRGETIAALSVAAIAERLGAKRLPRVVELLRTEAKTLAARFTPAPGMTLD